MNIRIPTAIATGLVSLGGVLMVTAGPAFAGCSANTPIPDGEIRKASDSYVGKNFLQCFSEPENTVEAEVAPGESQAFFGRFKNVESTTQNIRVRTSEVIHPNFTTKFFYKGRNITEKMTADGATGKLFKNVAPKEKTKPIRMVIKARPLAIAGDEIIRNFAGQYSTDAAVDNYDGALAVVTVAP